MKDYLRPGIMAMCLVLRREIPNQVGDDDGSMMERKPCPGCYQIGVQRNAILCVVRVHLLRF